MCERPLREVWEIYSVKIQSFFREVICNIYYQFPSEIYQAPQDVSNNKFLINSFEFFANKNMNFFLSFWLKCFEGLHDIYFMHLLQEKLKLIF